MITDLTTEQILTIMKKLKVDYALFTEFCGALYDVYEDFIDTDYTDILYDIKVGYLTYHETKPVDAYVTCADSDAGYLWYYDGDVEDLVPVNEVSTISIKATIKDELKGKLESTLALLKQEKVDEEAIRIAIKNIQLAINMID